MKMFKRLTVQQIQQIKTPIVVKQSNIRNAYFTEEHAFIIEQSKPQILQKIPYCDFQTVECIKLPENIEKSTIKSLIQVDGLIIFALQGSSYLFFINSQRQTFQLQSHLKPINQIIYFALQKQIITCSDDFTIRVWEHSKGKITPNKKKHIYLGHQNKVVLLCPMSSHNLFVSASIDNSVIFWRNAQQYYLKKFNSPITNFLYCEKSNQCLIFCQNFQVYAVELNKAFHLIEISDQSSEIQEIRSFKPQNCYQIDDSFVMFLENQHLVFLQKNISLIIKRIELASNKQKILSMIQASRMVIFAKQGKGIYLIRF